MTDHRPASEPGLAHGPLEKLAENLWRVEGDLPNFALKRVMTVVRLSSGRLLIHNAIMLNEPAQLDLLGSPEYLVVPNGWHRLDAAAFRARYPSSRVVIPPAARKKVSQVVPVDLTMGQFPPDDTVRFEVLDGLRGMEGVMLVRSSDGLTLVFTDAIFNLTSRIPGLTGFLYHEVIGSKVGPRVTRVAKLMMVKDNKAYRRHLERLAALPDVKRVIVAHGDVGDRSTLEAAIQTV